MTLSVDQKFELVARRQTFVEHGDAESLKELLARKDEVKIAWETTPTGKPHVGYFIPLAKIVDFLRAGLHRGKVTVYYLDVYGFLVNYVHSMEVVEHRRKYYHHLVTAILRALGVRPSQVSFVSESSLAYSKDFVVDSHRICAMMTQQDARDSMEEVARTVMLSPMLCAVQQSLSEPYLDIDIQFGGEDQYGLFQHANKFIPLLGYRKREHLMNAMLAGLDGLKMSSSKPASTKIEFLDAPETVRQKITDAACPERTAAGNGVLYLLRDVLLPISELWMERRRGQTGLNQDEGRDTPGGDQRPFAAPNAPDGSLLTVHADTARHYVSYEALEADYVAGKVDSRSLKAAVIDALNRLLTPIRDAYAESKEWQEIDALAYPDGN